MNTKEDLLKKFKSISPSSSRCYEFLNYIQNGEYLFLNKIGLILLTPETFITGKVHEFTKRFCENGLYLLDFSILDHLSCEDSSSMFIPEWIPSEFRWWLFSKRYQMGAVAAFLVYIDKCDNIHETLNELKGNRIFSESKLGTWRHDFKAINAVFNYVHCADDFAYVLRNTTPFFSTERIYKAILNMQSNSINKCMNIEQWENAYVLYLSAYEQTSINDTNFMDLYLSLLHKIILKETSVASSKEILNEIFLYRKSFSICNDENKDELKLLMSKIESLVPKDSNYAELFSIIRTMKSDLDWDKYFTKFIDPYFSLNDFARTILISTLFYAKQELNNYFKEEKHDHKELQ